MSEMIQAGRLKTALVLLVLACGLGTTLISGCSHKSNVDTPQSIKAAMGGNYSPEAQAAGRANQQQEQQLQAQMIQSRGTASVSVKH